MATKHLNKIFLSASIPFPDRDKEFYDTADIIAIRDSVRALAAVVIPDAHLVWGGHPSITPLIRYVMEKMSSNLKQHVTLYQSLFFEEQFPSDNFDFENIVLTKKVAGDEKKSIDLMRRQMISENDFKAAIFIGGMGGILEEYDLIRSMRPGALILPIASTGAAARVLYYANPTRFNKRLLNDYAFMALFKDLLTEII